MQLSEVTFYKIHILDTLLQLLKITKEKELKIDYLTWQLNNNNTYSEVPNRKGDPKNGDHATTLLALLL